MSYHDIVADFKHYKHDAQKRAEDGGVRKAPFNYGSQVKKRSYGDAERRSDITANIIGKMMSKQISIDDVGTPRSASSATSVRSPQTPRGRPIGSTQPYSLRGSARSHSQRQRDNTQYDVYHPALINKNGYKSPEARSSEGHSAQQLRQTIALLKDENQKLRVIEEQFWVLLSEREELLQMNERQMISSSAEPRSFVPFEARNGSKTPFSDDGRRDYTREDIMAMEQALGQCMDIILQYEIPPTTSDHDTTSIIRDFIAFRRQQDERKNASPDDQTASAALVLADTEQNLKEELINAHDTITALKATVHEQEADMQRLQEELIRTDNSRLQGLEDSERYRDQVMSLSGAVSELRLSLQEERDAVVRLRQQLLSEVTFYQDEVRNREQECERIRHSMSIIASKYEASLRQISDGEEVRAQKQLLDDATRIRSEINTRAVHDRKASPQSSHVCDVEASETKITEQTIDPITIIIDNEEVA